MKALFGWDYNTWCKCHYYGEYGHIAMNCIKHYFKKRDSTVRCFICTKLGHIAKNCMNIGMIEDEKKARVDNIRKHMRQQWFPKSIENTGSSNDGHVTQEVGDSTISN